ncbi:MAG TPA: hypothetical protein VFF73_32155 [Planctomycetota bacterium]|nr:hypothetical protein [Planctomycetota bacterium]
MSSTNSSSIPSTKGIELKADLAIQGLLTKLPAGVTQMLVGTTTFQLPDLIKHGQELLQPWKDVRAAHTTIKTAMVTRPSDKKNLEGFLADLKVSLMSIFGRESQSLNDFGMKPQPQKKPLTTEQKALRAAKAKLTRQQRGTLSKTQKAAIRQTQNPTVTINPDGTSVIAGANGTAPPAAPSPAASTNTTNTLNKS